MSEDLSKEMLKEIIKVINNLKKLNMKKFETEIEFNDSNKYKVTIEELTSSEQNE
ncbi:hypothetical protein KY314_05170 [Candidatus Woesearchaeota archaeon]|nr:hypothetical protein [Candidatus Woesearchaeota archaeon]